MRFGLKRRGHCASDGWLSIVARHGRENQCLDWMDFRCWSISQFLFLSGSASELGDILQLLIWQIFFSPSPTIIRQEVHFQPIYPPLPPTHKPIKIFSLLMLVAEAGRGILKRRHKLLRMHLPEHRLVLLFYLIPHLTLGLTGDDRHWGWCNHDSARWLPEKLQPAPRHCYHLVSGTRVLIDPSRKYLFFGHVAVTLQNLNRQPFTVVKHQSVWTSAPDQVLFCLHADWVSMATYPYLILCRYRHPTEVNITHEPIQGWFIQINKSFRFSIHWQTYLFVHCTNKYVF